MAENPRIEELRRRVQADPASIAFAALAEEFRRVGRYQDAIETCRTGLQRHPAYLSARVTLGRALIETGDYDGAREELETVLRSAPENLAALRGIEQIHERLGHSTEMHPDLHEIVREPIRLAAEARQTPPPAPPPHVDQPVSIPLVPDAPQSTESPTAAAAFDGFGFSFPADARSHSQHEEHKEHEAHEAEMPNALDIFTAALQRPAAGPAAPESQPSGSAFASFDSPSPLARPLASEPPPIAFEVGTMAFEAPVLRTQDRPDPRLADMLVRLERFLGAIHTARHA